jgi:hypothetical protein
MAEEEPSEFGSGVSRSPDNCALNHAISPIERLLGRWVETTYILRARERRFSHLL